jgi:hypothetical protein
LSTTQIYTQPRLEEILEKLSEHFARPRAADPVIGVDYDRDEVRELLGLRS